MSRRYSAAAALAPKTYSMRVEAALVGLVPAAVEVAHGRGEEDAGGIDARLGQRLETRADGKQLAADRAGARIGLARRPAACG